LNQPSRVPSAINRSLADNSLEVLRGVFVLFFFAVPGYVAKVTKSALLPWVTKLGGVFWLDIKRANIDFLRRTMIEIVAYA